MLGRFLSGLHSRVCILQNVLRSFSEKSVSIDASEATTFAILSKRWWDKNGEFKVLHAMNPLRLEMVNNLFKDESPKPWYPLYGKRIMDIGCGGGILTEPLGRLGANVLGIDMLSEVTEAAKEHLRMVNPDVWKNVPFGPPEYQNISSSEAAEKYPGLFDAIIASEVLEHVSDWEQLVSDASKCLKPGGHFIATTVNRTFLSYWFGIVVAENTIKIVPKGMHTWNKFIEPSELSMAAVRYNLQPRKVLGMTYCPLANEWSWISSQAINYAFHAVKIYPNDP
ncbi:unnamed protein product [Hymenolepis diminuta]|uniref:Ubiquinone biosynthesis O-methyltransferase, mitochondrial n=1 Tax=Hymenolepis diminuta TaxID=6216 RepID=A0A0R3S9J8_HYMDI|nr:unnamed protein product [Hymenolepis diminuta]VUZ56984.1 unnamed protein product [Hymenolepis diminuta]